MSIKALLLLLVIAASTFTAHGARVKQQHKIRQPSEDGIDNAHITVDKENDQDGSKASDEESLQQVQETLKPAPRSWVDVVSGNETSKATKSTSKTAKPTFANVTRVAAGGTRVKHLPTNTTHAGRRAPTVKTITMISWNVEHVNSASSKTRHVQYIQKTLRKFGEAYSPGIIVLQEVEKCELVELNGYTCVDSVVDAGYERKMSFVTLGNVLLYRTEMFDAERENWIKTERKSDILDVTDKRGDKLRYHHSQECTWDGLSNGHGCDRSSSDVPRFNSVLLHLKPGYWRPSAYEAVAAGIRIVNVHLFSGGRRDTTLEQAGETRRQRERRNEQARHARRGFQLRSMFATVSRWNKQLQKRGLGKDPVTLYAGDFNTRKAYELRDLVKISEVDYGFQLMCPASGLRKNVRPCRSAKSTKRTARGGFLDHIVYDSHAAWMPTKYSVLKQPKGGKSDHNPVLTQLQLAAN